MERYYTLKINISNVLTVDYVGALCATLVFPFVLLPFWGTFRSSLFFGMVNMGIGFMMLWCFRTALDLEKRRVYLIACIVVFLFLGTMFTFSRIVLKNWNNAIYRDRIIYSRQSEFQHIVLTRFKSDVRMFLDGNLQFSAIDEYRYHESLVHVPFSLAPEKRKILLLGGGDGLAVREMLKYGDVRSIVLVDIDPAIIEVATTNRWVRELNQNSLADPRVTIINRDAFIFLEQTEDLFDIIIADLPDPNNAALARLYSREFYELLGRRLARTGIFLTQATSPFFAKEAFWCINATIRQTGLKVYPYHAYVPSFGDWGFVMASGIRLDPDQVRITVPTRFLDGRVAKDLFVFTRDLADTGPMPSTLDHPHVLSLYMKGWKYWE